MNFFDRGTLAQVYPVNHDDFRSHQTSSEVIVHMTSFVENERTLLILDGEN